MRAAIMVIIGVSTLHGCGTTSSRVAKTHLNDDGEGLSCERRVKVAAIPEEYAWVRSHYPGAKVKMQSLSRCDNSPTDKLHVTTTDDRELTFFFDISSFF